MSDDSLAVLLRALPRLRYLNISGSLVHSIAHGTSGGALQSLLLRQCARVTDDTVLSLCFTNTSLRALHLNHVQISPSTVAAILPRLSRARCGGGLALSLPPSERMADCVLEALVSVSGSLVDLDLCRTGIAKPQLTELMHQCAQLRRLSLCSSSAVSDLRFLMPKGTACAVGGCDPPCSRQQWCCRLTKLALGACPLQDDALIELAALVAGSSAGGPLQLRSLRLSACTALSDAGVVPLLRLCPALEKLELADLPLISDVTARQLSELVELRKIDLTNDRRVGDVAPNVIGAACRRLESVQLGGTSVSAEGCLGLLQVVPPVFSSATLPVRMHDHPQLQSLRCWKLVHFR